MARNTRPGMPTRQQILEFIESSSSAVGKREIAKHFGLHGADKIALKALLKDMTDEGLVDMAPGRAFHKHGGLPKVTVLRVAAVEGDAVWAVPYLPIDPADLGRTYDSVIRVNSQSGKGGIAFLLEREHGVVMPRRMQVEFSATVQRHTDASAQAAGVQLVVLQELRAQPMDPRHVQLLARCHGARQSVQEDAALTQRFTMICYIKNSN